jgi:hypothetical protein
MQAEPLHTTKFLELCQARVSGGYPWVYARRPTEIKPKISDAVVIAPVINFPNGDQYFHFLETARAPVQVEHGIERVIEFPAGITTDTPSKRTARSIASKELREELFLKKSDRFKLELLAKAVPSSPGCTSEISDIFMARFDSLKKPDKLIFSKTRPEIKEEIYSDHFVRVDKIFAFFKKMARQGKRITAQTYTAALLALQKLNMIS